MGKRQYAQLTVKDLIKHLQQKDQDEVIAYSLWSWEDAQMRAKDIDIELTDEESKEAISRVETHKDSSIGISWDVLDCHIIDINNERD